jgi:hypothetical protein
MVEAFSVYGKDDLKKDKTDTLLKPVVNPHDLQKAWNLCDRQDYQVVTYCTVDLFP